MVEHASSSAAGVAGTSRDATSSHQQNSGITSIDDIVSLIRSIEGTPDQLNNAAFAALLGQIRDTLLPALKKQYHVQKGKGQRLFTQALQGGYDPLSMLDPARNTLGYAYILTCRANQIADVEAAELLTQHIDSFSRHFTPAQLVGAGEIVTALARSIANIGRILDNPIGALTSLLRLFDGYRSIQGGVHNLTTLHPIVLYQCLRAQHYSAAYDWILRFDIVSADAQVSPLLASDILEYFYYGGLVFTRLGRLDKACEAFELCVTSPAQQVSAIQIDAYKKLILVQLLKDGKASNLPRYTSQAVTKAIRSKMAGLELYQEIATAYEAQHHFTISKKDRERVQRQGALFHQQLQSTVEKNMNILLKDVNFGLVKRLLALYTRRRIQRLGKVFGRLTIGKIVELLGDAVEGSVGDKACAVVYAALQQMNDEGWVRIIFESTGSAGNTIVRFEEKEVDHTGLQAAQRLTMIMQEAKFSDQAVERKKRSIKCSEAYLSKQLNSTNRGEWGSSINVDDFDDEAFL